MDVSLTPAALTGPVRANRYICLALLCPLLAQERPFGGLPNWSRMGWTGRAPAPNDTQSQWGAFEEHKEHMP